MKDPGSGPETTRDQNSLFVVWECFPPHFEELTSTGHIMSIVHPRLRRQFSLLLVGLAFLLPVGSMFAQSDIIVSTQSAPVNTLTINDIDFIHATAPKWIFSIDLRTANGAAVMATMTIRLTATLADGEDFGGQPIITVVTNPFQINGSRTISNLDFQDVSLRKSYEVNQSAKRHLEQTALPSGRMPAGAYNFAIEVVPEAGTGTPGSGSFTLTLSNPSSVELLLPADGDNTTQFPLFQWVFDGSRSTLAVFEKLPGQATLEEAASGTPQLSTEVTTTTFQYPTAGARALEPGKTYVWYVEGHVLTSGGGTTLIRSPLRSFTVQTAGAAAPSASMLDELEQALGPQYKALFDEIRSQGLSATGSVHLNGATITAAELMQIINQIRQNPGSVVSANLE